MTTAPAGTITNPFSIPDSEGYTWLKGNLHSHTTTSDGQPSPQERLDGYVGQGYAYLCLSDHHEITRIDTVQPPVILSSSRVRNCIPTTPSAASATTSFAST